MNPEDYLKELEAAIAEYRFNDVKDLSEKIKPSKFSAKQAKKTLSLMRRKRLFSEMEKVAGLFTLSGHSAPVIRRQYSQALLDQNRLSQGLAALEALFPHVEDDPNEKSEVIGLTGRAFKQFYINDGDKENLQKAIQAYEPCWKERMGDYRWHGINLVSLFKRAVTDGVDPGIAVDINEVANTILKEIEDLDQSAQVWDYATATEAAIAIGSYDEAIKWVGKYVKHPEADAFELGSTLRQLKEIWKLEGTEIGNKLLPVIEFALLHREGGELNLTSDPVSDKSGFEAVYGDESSTNIEWMDTMIERCKSVARVFNTATGQRVGTGFLIKGSDLRQEWGDAQVFVTNAHVVSDCPSDEAPLNVDDGSVEFTRLPDRPKFRLGEILFRSPKTDLDVSILRITQIDGGAPLLKPTAYLPLVPKSGEEPQRIYVVGHPNGAEMTVTLYDNDLVRYVDNKYVHYRSPTEGGHSGSPVLTRELKLFAIHHRALKELQVNEGVLLPPIREATSN